jgi:hypothetical protein
MPTTTTTASRSELVEPDENHDGGTLLHSRVTTLRTVLGDNAASRYKEFTTIADNTITETKHNLGVNLNQLTVVIYTGSGTNLVRVQDPLGAAIPWAINEKSGSEKTTIEVTTPNGGGTHTFAVVVLHDIRKDFGAAGDHVAVTSNLTLRDKVLYRVDTTTPRTLTLPAVSQQLYIPIKDITGSASVNNITVNTPGAETIEGAASFVASSDYMAFAIISDGVNYFVI